MINLLVMYSLSHVLVMHGHSRIDYSGLITMVSRWVVSRREQRYTTGHQRAQCHNEDKPQGLNLPDWSLKLPIEFWLSAD